MPKKATTPRSTAAPPLWRRSTGKAAAFEITSETIARDIAAFRKLGGRIEVLGNTPLRMHVTASRSKAAGQQAKDGSKKAEPKVPVAKGAAGR